jgi:hypothetical protein
MCLSFKVLIWLQYDTVMSTVSNEIPRAALGIESSCFTQALKFLCYIHCIFQAQTTQMYYFSTLYKCSDITCLQRDRNDKRTSLCQWTSGDWRHSYPMCRLAIHRDAVFLFRSKRSGAAMLAARCCHVTAESESWVQLSLFESFDRVLRFGNDHISTFEVPQYFLEKEMLLSHIKLRTWEEPK